MADNQRIEDLRRRVQKDPASIAFAQLAEVCRRAGQLDESVSICRAGLAIHPEYLSARVTLGRALLELNQLEEALAELEHVLASAPENLAALRGVAEIHHRRGDLGDALFRYRGALALAKNDPDLEQTVADLSRQIEPPKPPASADGLTLEQVTRELAIHRPPAVAEPVPVPMTTPEQQPRAFSRVEPPPAPVDRRPPPSPGLTSHGQAPVRTDDDDRRASALQTIAALEQWLGAIHAARTDRHA